MFAPEQKHRATGAGREASCCIMSLADNVPDTHSFKMSTSQTVRRDNGGVPARTSVRRGGKRHDAPRRKQALAHAVLM